MKVLKTLWLGLVALVVFGALSGALLIWRGFRATATPSAWETAVARTMRNLAIPGRARSEKNPFAATPSEAARAGRESYLTQCASCHGIDGSGKTRVGLHLYPRVPDLRAEATQKLTDGELHYIIENGVQLTGMPGLGEPTHRVGRRELEACSFSPELPASQPRRAVATSDNGRFGTLHRIAGLREVPRGDLYALEEDADGERGARSCDSSRCHHC